MEDSSERMSEEEGLQLLAVLHIVGPDIFVSEHSDMFGVEGGYLLYSLEDGPITPEDIRQHIQEQGYKVDENTLIILQAHGFRGQGREEDEDDRRHTIVLQSTGPGQYTDEFLQRFSQVFGSEDFPMPLTCILGSCHGGSANKIADSGRLSPGSMLVTTVPAKRVSYIDIWEHTNIKLLSAMRKYHSEYRKYPSPPMIAAMLSLYTPEGITTNLVGGTGVYKKKVRYVKPRREKFVSGVKGERFTHDEMIDNLRTILRNPRDFLRATSKEIFRTMSGTEEIVEQQRRDEHFLSELVDRINIDVYKLSMLSIFIIKDQDSVDSLSRRSMGATEIDMPALTLVSRALGFSEDKTKALIAGGAKEVCEVGVSFDRLSAVYDRVTANNFRVLVSRRAINAYKEGIQIEQLANIERIEKIIALTDDHVIRAYRAGIRFEQLASLGANKIINLTGYALQEVYDAGATFEKLNKVYEQGWDKFGEILSDNAIKAYKAGAKFDQLDKMYDENKRKFDSLTSSNAIKAYKVGAKFEQLDKMYDENKRKFDSLTSNIARMMHKLGFNFSRLEGIYNQSPTDFTSRIYSIRRGVESGRAAEQEQRMSPHERRRGIKRERETPDEGRKLGTKQQRRDEEGGKGGIRER